jgi:hypothetical protein
MLTVRSGLRRSRTAVSTVKCNTKMVFLDSFGEGVLDEFGIDLARGSVAQHGAWSVVEHGLDVGEFLGRDGGQIRALREELAQQAVEVFIGRSLPRAAWVAEVDRHTGGCGELFVACHFRAAVVGEAAAKLGDDAGKAAAEAFKGVGGGAAIHLSQQHVAAGALDGRADGAGVAGTLDEVAFPVAWHPAVVGLGWPLGQRDDVGDVRLARGAPGARHALGVALAQAVDDLGSQLAAAEHVDGAVDGLVTDTLAGVVGVDEFESAGDLLGRDGAQEFTAHVPTQWRVQRRAELAALGVDADRKLTGEGWSKFGRRAHTCGLPGSLCSERLTSTLALASRAFTALVHYRNPVGRRLWRLAGTKTTVGTAPARRLPGSTDQNP